MLPDDLVTERVREMIADAVYRGASKAIAVYLLVSASIGFLYFLFFGGGGE